MLIQKSRHIIRLVLLLAGLIFVFSTCGMKSDGETKSKVIIEDTMVSYPGRTFSYKDRFRDTQTKQEQAARAIGLSTPPQNRQQAAKMRSQLIHIKTNENFIVDSLTHSIPYLVPAAAKELESIGQEFADILQRNGLPHYQFYVTSVLRTKDDIKCLQKSLFLRGQDEAKPIQYGKVFRFCHQLLFLLRKRRHRAPLLEQNRIFLSVYR